MSNASLNVSNKNPPSPTYVRRSGRKFCTHTPTPEACASATDIGHPTTVAITLWGFIHGIMQIATKKATVLVHRGVETTALMEKALGKQLGKPVVWLKQVSRT